MIPAPLPAAARARLIEETARAALAWLRYCPRAPGCGHRTCADYHALARALAVPTARPPAAETRRT
jgi:hypothetical protein